MLVEHNLIRSWHNSKKTDANCCVNFCCWAKAFLLSLSLNSCSLYYYYLAIVTLTNKISMFLNVHCFGLRCIWDKTLIEGTVLHKTTPNQPAAKVACRANPSVGGRMPRYLTVWCAPAKFTELCFTSRSSHILWQYEQENIRSLHKVCILDEKTCKFW